MKNSSAYAGKIKKVFGQLKQSMGRPEIPPPDDPLRCLALAILGAGTTETEASAALDRAFLKLVDWNDVRVSTAAELQRVIGDGLPDGLKRCQQLISALQSIYDRENRPSLERLLTLGRREAKQYLEKLKGVDEYSVGFVMLWCLGGHAIPVNNPLFEALRQAELVHPDASRSEVQAFLERQISASDAKEFCLLMRRFAEKRGGKVIKAKASSQRAKATGS